MFANVDRRIGERIGCIHKVHTCQIFVRRHDVQSILALNTHEVRQSGTRTNEYSLEAFCLKLVGGDCLADDTVGGEYYAHLLQILYLYVNDAVWQTELWNTIFQHTANLVQCLEYMYLVALLHHVTGKAQSRRTATYYSHLNSVLWCHVGYGDVATLTFKVGSKTLQITDSYSRFVHLQMDTLAFALFLLWANTATYGW